MLSMSFLSSFIAYQGIPPQRYKKLLKTTLLTQRVEWVAWVRVYIRLYGSRDVIIARASSSDCTLVSVPDPTHYARKGLVVVLIQQSCDIFYV